MLKRGEMPTINEETQIRFCSKKHSRVATKRNGREKKTLFLVCRKGDLKPVLRTSGTSERRGGWEGALPNISRKRKKTYLRWTAHRKRERRAGIPEGG